MNTYPTLNQLNPGEHALIHSLNSKGSMRRRLLDMGLIEHTKIECLGKSPFGDPIAFLIRGAVIAIRSEDCADIEINMETDIETDIKMKIKILPLEDTL